jgi:hypothetical protein
MTVPELQAALESLSTEEKQAFILETLPGLAREAMQDSGFLLQLFPVFLGILQDSGIQLSQLLQMASLLQPAGTGD